MKRIFGRDAWENVLGMNARNARVAAENSPEAIRLVDSKYETKKVLEEAGVPVSPTILVVRDRRDIANFDWEDLPDGWVLKPDRGRQGIGIVIATSREGPGWCMSSGDFLGRDEIVNRLHFILDGEFSSEGVEEDRAFFEPLIVAHPALARLVPSGLPDVRLVCHREKVLLGMIRLPTEASDGRANLHQSAIGALVDLDSGRITRAMLGEERIEDHPDTGERLVGVEVPGWETIMEVAPRCSEATGLGYLGVDAVIDEEQGPLVLEVNARPGLEIQNVAGVGLAELISKTDPR